MSCGRTSSGCRSWSWLAYLERSTVRPLPSQITYADGHVGNVPFSPTPPARAAIQSVEFAMHAFTVHPRRARPPRLRRSRADGGAAGRSVTLRHWRVWAVRDPAWLVPSIAPEGIVRSSGEELDSTSGSPLAPRAGRTRATTRSGCRRDKTSRDGWYCHVAKENRIRRTFDRSWRKEWEKKGAQAKGGQRTGGSPGGGFGPGGPKAGGLGGGAGGRGAPSAEEMQKRRKQYLDRTSPEERAKRDQFRKDMDTRRKQRGLPPRA